MVSGLRGRARRCAELRARVYDAIEAIYECDSDDDAAWDAAWRRLHYAAEAWIGSNPMPRPKNEADPRDTEKES